MKVLVTGHDGYLGVGVVARLRGRGDEVVGLDTELFGHRGLGPAERPDQTHRIDIRDVPGDLLEGVDVVVHLAGLSNDPLGERSPVVTDAVNHVATLRLADLAREHGVRRFVFASTCSVHGGAGDATVDEDTPVAPLTAYARSKADAEVGLAKRADGTMAVTVLRLGTVYGAAPRLRADLVVNNLVGWALTTGEVILRSDGTAWRPLVHVDDVADALTAATDLDDPLHVLNVVGADGDLQIIDVARRIGELTGAQVRQAEGAGTDPRSYRVDGSRLRRVLPAGVATRHLDDGIRELIAAYRAHGFRREDLDVTLRRNAWLDRLVADGRLTADLRWRAQEP